MTDLPEPDDSMMNKWKAGWWVLWRLFIVYLGFSLVVMFCSLLLRAPVFETPLGGVVRWIIVVLLILVGLPLWAYYAGKWYEVTRGIWSWSNR